MSVDFGGAIGSLISPVIGFLTSCLSFAFFVFLIIALLFFGGFFIRYRFNPFRLNADKLREPYIKYKYHDLLRWLLVDFLERGAHRGEFREYGFTFFVGRQGAGKTISAVRYLELAKVKYPKCMIVTNFEYCGADFMMKDWRDLLNVRNGEDGIIFAIDEIHSEYSSAAWKDFPENLLSEISQQRKQRVKIIATAQFFTRIAKPLREQANTVVSCSTFHNRFVRNRTYDAIDYAMVIDNPNIVKKKLKPLSKGSFVQSDMLRACYDTFEKVERMKKIKFIPRNERE